MSGIEIIAISASSFSTCGSGLLNMKRTFHETIEVSHDNQRDVMPLIINFFIFSVVYCTYFNTIFLSGQLEEQTWGQILKFIFPMVNTVVISLHYIEISLFDRDLTILMTFLILKVMIVTGLDASWLQLYIFFWSVHFAAVLLTTVLLLYHANLVLQGKMNAYK